MVILSTGENWAIHCLTFIMLVPLLRVTDYCLVTASDWSMGDA